MQEFDSNYITTAPGVPVDATTIKVPEQPAGLAASSITTNNTIQNKTTLLQNKVQDKLSTLTGKFEPAMLESMPDADSPIMVGVQGGRGKGGDLTGRPTEDRAIGFDAYEVAHPDDPYQKTESGIAKYERQRQRLANQIQEDPSLIQKLGIKDPKNITNDDIARAGTREQLLGLYNLIPGEKAPWEPGPLDYYDSNHALELGSKENPLNIPVERATTGEYDYFGRPMSVVRNKDTDVTVPEALGYKGDGSEDAKYDANKSIAALKARGELTPELEAYLNKSAKYVGTNQQSSNRLTLEDIQKLTDKDGTFGEAVDVAQSSLMKQWAGSVNALNKVVRAAGKGLGVEQSTLDEYVPEKVKIGLFGDGKHTADEYLKEGGVLADKEAEVKAATRVEQSTLMKGAEKDLVEGNYLDATVKVLKAMPTTAGDSVGEITALALRTPGLLTAIAARVSNDADTYKENNGKEPDNKWLATSVGTNAVALVTEKLLLNSGIGGVLEKGVSKLGRAGAVGKSVVGESIQEMYDQTQQEYMTQKEGQRTLEEVATSPSTVVAGIAGATMGGALRGTGESVGALKDALTSPKKLTPEQEEVLNKPEETITVKGEELSTGMSEDDVATAKDIYSMTKAGGTLQDARDLAEAVDKLELNKTKNDATFKLHEAAADRREALQAILRDSWSKATHGKNMEDDAEADEASVAFKDIIKGYKLSPRNRKTMNEMLVQGLMYGTEGGLSLNTKGMFGNFTGFNKAQGENEVLGMDDEIPATAPTSTVAKPNIMDEESLTEEEKKAAVNHQQNTLNNLAKGLKLPMLSMNLSKEETAELDELKESKADTKTIVEKKVEQTKKKSSKPTDEDLGVGVVVEDGYVKGISARTLNKLADMFDLDVKDVRDSIQYAVPAMQVKKMDTVSKQAAKVQYDTYYGNEGIVPSYIGFKKAVANGEVDEAVNYINKVRQAGTRLERELIKHTRATEELEKLVASILTKLNNGKISKEKAAIALDSLDTTVGKKYSINAMDVAKDKIPEEVQALMDKRKESKVPEVVKAKQEALDMVDTILAHERISRDKPVYEKSYVADRVKDFESRIAETNKSIEEQKLEIENAETREDKVVAKKVLAKLEKTLAEQEAALDTYNTKYADVEYTWKEVFNRDKDKTKKEVEVKSGEQVGKVTKEQAEEMEAKGREVSEDAVAEKRNVTAVKDIPNKVAELTRLRAELDNIRKDASKKFNDIKDRVQEVASNIGEEGSRLLGIQIHIANASDDLARYKAEKRRLTSELKKAEKLDEDLKNAAIESADAYAAVGQAGTEATPKVVRALINGLAESGKKVKLTILQVRRLIASRSVAEVKADLDDIASKIEATQNKIKRLLVVGKEEAKRASATKLTSGEATKIANAMKTINRLKRMIGMKVNREVGPNRVLDRRDAEIRKVWDKIKEIESSLYGTRLVEGSRVSGKENVSRNGNEVSTEIGRMVKYTPTLFGQVPARSLTELVPEDNGSRALYESIMKDAVSKMEKAIGNIKNDFTLADSPAMYFMRTANGKIDEQVASVVALAAKEWAATTAKASLMNDNDTIARMVGKLDGSQVTRAERRLLKEGRLLVNEATSLGGKIVNALGIREGSMPIGQYAQLKADFGNYGMSYLEKEGDIEFKKLPAAEWNKVFKEDKQIDSKAEVLLVKGLKDNVSKYEKMGPQVRDINEALDLSDFAKDYRVTPIKTEGKKYKIENGYSQAPEHNQDVLRKLESQKWAIATGAMDKLMELNKDKLKEYMGWKDLDSMNPKDGEITHTKEAKEAQESINREVEGNVEAITAMYSRYKEGLIPKDIYFEWFFAKNGRYMLDSVGVNPQVDKQLARFLVVPKEATEHIWNLNKEKDKLYFTSGIIQGLGVDLDNETTENLQRIGEDLLALNKDGVAELTRSMLDKGEYKLNGTKFKISHVGHTLQALTALEAAVDTKLVKAVVTMEFDSKTSGFFHKLMQLPFEEEADQEKWLAKTGAYVGKKLDEFRNQNGGTNDMMTTETDSYKTLTVDSAKELVGILDKDSELKAKFDAIKKSGVMPELVDEKSEATKEGRNLYKYPFMRFNYAESIGSNRKSMAYDLTNQVLDKIVTGAIPYDEKSKEMYDIIGVRSKEDLATLRKELATKDIDKVWINKVNVSTALEKVFNETYGAALEEVMSSNFGHILEANKLMIASTQVMADAFVAELKKYDTASGTQEELDKLIDKYIKVFPQIRAPFTSSRENGMAIIDTKRAPSGDKWKADTQLPDGKTRTVQALIQEFEKAKAAGAVIPTHWTDGGVIGEVLKQGGVLGIHDAIALGFNGEQIEKMIKDMNRASYEVNRDFNIMQNVYTALVESLENVSDEALASIQDNEYNKAGKDEEGMSIKDVVEAMRESTNMYNKRRADMYSKEVTVGNIIAYRDTVYTNTEAFEPSGTKLVAKEAAKKIEAKVREAVEEELVKCRGK